MFPLSLPRALSDKEIMESDQAAGLSYIHTVFDLALQSAPSAVILQDLDIIAKGMLPKVVPIIFITVQLLTKGAI